MLLSKLSPINNNVIGIVGCCGDDDVVVAVVVSTPLPPLPALLSNVGVT